jgi:hypothetical protein
LYTGIGIAGDVHKAYGKAISKSGYHDSLNPLQKRKKPDAMNRIEPKENRQGSYPLKPVRVAASLVNPSAAKRGTCPVNTRSTISYFRDIISDTPERVHKEGA